MTVSATMNLCKHSFVMRIASLNVQNLKLQRFKGQTQLHGAWDSDAPEDPSLDLIDRRLTGELLAEINADVVALQEVFDLETLDYFHNKFLVPTGAEPYPHRACIAGNDGRGLDVALISRHPLPFIKSHASLKLADVGIDPPDGVDPDLPVYRRDCLMIKIGQLTLFVCHFKSAYPNPGVAWKTRRLEALATRRLIERYFTKPENSLWLIVGDLNEPNVQDGDYERAIAPLESHFSEDLMMRLPDAERWTYYDPHSGLYHCPDALLASPELARLCEGIKPIVVRKGLGVEVSRFRGSRLRAVGKHRPHASDHAAVLIELDQIPSS